MANFLLDEKSDFLKVFLIGGILCLDKFIVLFCFDENEPFKLNKMIKVDMLISDDENQINDEIKDENNENKDNDNYKPITDGRITNISEN